MISTLRSFTARKSDRGSERGVNFLACMECRSVTSMDLIFCLLFSSTSTVLDQGTTILSWNMIAWEKNKGYGWPLHFEDINII